MPVVTISPKPTTHIKVTIGTDEYQTQVTSFAVTPQPQQVSIRGGAPDAHYEASVPGGWQLAIGVIQDWETLTSLCNFLLENEGEEATIVYKPINAGDAEFTVVVPSLIAPAIGGPVNQYNESTVTMGCSKPVKTPVV
jgi:hypothetical protein